MNSSLIKIVFALSLLIFFTACTQQQQRTDGIVINSFSGEPLNAEAGDNVRFFLDFENVGGTTARCGITELYGLESWYTLDSTRLSGARPWRDKSFSFSFSNNNLNLCYYDFSKGFNACGSYRKDESVSLSVFVSGAWNSFLTDYCNSYQSISAFPDAKFFSQLSPILPQRNRPGQSQTYDWFFKPPILPEGLKVDYDVTARVSYAYTSNAHINIKVFNKEEYRRRQNLGEQLDYPIDIVNSYNAPIQVNVRQGSSPIIVSTPSDFITDPIQRENYVLEFVNLGSGFPLPLESPDSGFVIAVVEANGPGVYFEDCLGQRGGTELLDHDIVRNLVKIRGATNSAPFSCTIAIDRAAWANVPTGTISLTFRALHRYYTDAETKVTVLGVEES